MRTPKDQFERDRTALKHYLLGRDYFEALTAMGIADRFHVGFRKDKQTPELHHQIGVCFNFINAPIPGLTRELECHALAALLLHDTIEDYDVSLDMLHGIEDYTKRLIKALTKVKDETREQLHERLLSHWIVPILKACDRDNNVMTMQGAFSVEKMKAYIEETRTDILPVLKQACRMYPLYTKAYNSLSTGIKKMLRIYEGFIAVLQDLTERAEKAERMEQLLSKQLEEAQRARFPASSLAGANTQAEVIADNSRIVSVETLEIAQKPVREIYAVTKPAKPRR